jgi:hypothetical protein
MPMANALFEKCISRMSWSIIAFIMASRQKTNWPSNPTLADSTALSGYRVESLAEVGDEVVGVFDADRDA